MRVQATRTSSGLRPSALNCTGSNNYSSGSLEYTMQHCCNTVMGVDVLCPTCFRGNLLPYTTRIDLLANITTTTNLGLQRDDPAAVTQLGFNPQPIVRDVNFISNEDPSAATSAAWLTSQQVSALWSRVTGSSGGFTVWRQSGKCAEYSASCVRSVCVSV